MRRRSRFAEWRNRLADRLAQSSHVFLLGLVIACGVEVLVDWNQTLFEVNVLRDQVRQKGLNYAGILEKAVVDPLLGGDRVTLDRLTSGLIDDEDAIYVRIVDHSGQVVYDSLDRTFEQAYLRRGKGAFRVHDGHWLDRDRHGVLFDPDGFKKRLASSRYRDVPQMYNDAMVRLLARFTTPTPLPPLRAQIVYQDRLRDENHRRDDSVTWAIAPLTKESPLGSRQVGAVLVAFDMTRINGAVRTKYLKGLGMIVFFVALIVVQNISGRRDKLRLLDVGRRYAAAKQAIHEAMRTEPLELLIEHGKLVTHGLIDQAKESVDGMVWDAIAREGRVDVLVADPDGDGIDAAAIGLHILRVFRGLRQPKPGATASSPALPGLDDEVIALGAATHDIPLTRPIGLLLLQIESSGEFEAIVGDATLLQLLGQPASAQPTREPLTGPTPDGVIGPLSRVRGALAIGATLLCTTLGKDRRTDSSGEGDALATFLSRHHRPARDLAHPEDVAAWLRSKYPGQVENDLAVVAISRTAKPSD